MRVKDMMDGKLFATCSASHQELLPPAIWLCALPAEEKGVSRYMIRERNSGKLATCAVTS